ncbi:MAG: hypothetical protein KAS32_04915 [Candidatus Peribacteraceae bacterium]|nr:hypothetical protein [Candidatus Peribacteraceae bacterium]
MDYRFEDKTSDKKYFTVIPNYILNHSDAVVKALYLDIKRAAGEDGRSFMTEETMCKRNGIGEKRLHKALKYLLNHKWIEFVGMTPAKTRPIKTYKVLDIWKKNIEFFSKKKIPSKSGVSKDTRQKKQDTRQKQDKIPARSKGIRRTLLRRTNKKKYTSLKDIGEKEFEMVADQYGVTIKLVQNSYEDLINYCQAHGKRYKNYLAALRNFVKKDAKVNGITKRPKTSSFDEPQLTTEERIKARKRLNQIRKKYPVKSI